MISAHDGNADDALITNDGKLKNNYGAKHDAERRSVFPAIDSPTNPVGRSNSSWNQAMLIWLRRTRTALR